MKTKFGEIMRVAVVTPTWQRAHFLRQTFRYFQAQQAPNFLLKWFVLDDSAQPMPDAWAVQSDAVHYQWLPQRMTLGAKRNFLNDCAQAWGADYVCSMDDDDWYGAHYVADMCEILRTGEHAFAGSGDDYYYHADH